jgi:hypothetical protein
MGPITISTDGKIHLYDGQTKTIDEWRNLTDNQRIINAESDDVGIKSIPVDKYLNEDYSINNTNSGTYSRYVRNTKWESGPNAGQDSGVYATGGGSGTPTKLPNQPQKHPETSAGDQGIVEMNGGVGDMTVAQWNAQSPAQRQANAQNIHSMPGNYDLYSDYTMRSNTGGGTGGGTGGNHPPGSFGGTPVGDSETLGSGGTGYYKTVTGYNVPDYIVTPGHGATSTAKWSNPNMDPRTWVAKPMVDPDKQGLWKVVDNKDINIAANFKSEAEANEFIQEHIYHFNPTTPPGGGGTTNPPPTGGGGTTNPPPTGGGDSGIITGDKNTLGPGGEGYYKTVTGYNVPGYIQSPGHGATSSAKWTNPNMDPNSWRAVPMVDDPTLWKVVDNKGVNIAAKFKSEAEANEFIQEHIFVAHGGGIEGDEPGGGGGTTNPPPTGGGGTTNPPPSSGGVGSGVGGVTFPEGFPFQNAPKGPGGGPIIAGIEFPKGFPFHKTGLPGGGGGGTTNPPPTGGGTPLGNAYFAGAYGMSYNHLTSTHPVEGATGGTGGTGGNGGGGGTGGGSGTGAVGDTVVGYNGNFNYEVNNRRLRIQGGKVVENTLTATEMASAKAAFKAANKKDLVFSSAGTNANGTPGTTGTNGNASIVNTPSQNGQNGFTIQNPMTTSPNTVAGAVGAQTLGTGTGVQQSQVINQSSSINGQGNNSNFDTMVGTNSRLQIQNGKVVTATGIFAGQGAGTGGTGGTGGTNVTNGQIRDTIFKSMSLTGALAPWINPNIPTSNQPDSVTGFVDAQGDPLFPNYIDRGMMTTPIPGGPGTPGGPGGGGGFNFIDFWKKLFDNLLRGIGNAFKFNVNNVINGQTFWKITNDQIIDSIKRY